MTLLVAPRTPAEREALQESATQHFVQQLLRNRLRRCSDSAPGIWYSESVLVDA